jgi:hypothetical protein
MAFAEIFDDCSKLTIILDPKLKKLMKDKFAALTKNQIVITDKDAGGFIKVEKDEKTMGSVKECTLKFSIE